MKQALTISSALLAFSTSALAATPASVQFVGSLQQDNTTPLTFDIQVPSGQIAILKLGDGHALSFATAGSPGHPDQTRIVLTDVSGTQLHSQTIPNTGLASTTFDYLICNGQTTFISPAPEEQPSCASSEP